MSILFLLIFLIHLKSNRHVVDLRKKEIKVIETLIINNDKIDKNRGNNNYDSLDSGNNVIRNQLKQMMRVSWKSYKTHCFGENELRPLTKECHDGVFPGKMGLSIIDSMDTLYIMGLYEEFEEAFRWLGTVNFREFGEVSVFETNIRYVGGLLACYYLTKRQLFLEKADEIASLIIPACDRLNGLCYSLFNLNNGQKRNYNWASDRFVLAEFGSLHLEFMALHRLTNKKVYKEISEVIRNNIIKNIPSNNLLSNYFYSETKTSRMDSYYSIGALGDSFYEYLIKSYIITQHEDTEALNLFTKLLKALEEKLLDTNNGHLYFSTGNKIPAKMEHLACFSGGMYALAAKHVTDPELIVHYKKNAEGLTKTCYLSYNSTATGIGPEEFDPTDFKPINSHYLLRPETIESIFYLWRTTHDIKYRQWARQIFESIEKNCYIKDVGFSGLLDVNKINDKSLGNMDNIQQSYFLAETMKYLFLIFSDDDVISIDEWVFNTEAHPFPFGSY